MIIRESPEIWHRGDFPLLAVWRQYTRIVEVGVDKGDYSQVFLRRWSDYGGQIYLGVDSYVPYYGMPWGRDADFLSAVNKFEMFGDKAKLIRGSSKEVSEMVQALRGSNQLYGDLFDLVYIDGDHTYDGVYRDLENWWPHVREGGIIAGHDWSVETGDHQDVQKAVIDFLCDKVDEIYYTYKDNPQSWYTYKGGKPDPLAERKHP